MLKVETTKQSFLRTELWNLSIAGAFQRGNVYVNNTEDAAKDDFKRALKNLLGDIVQRYVESSIAEDKHYENIRSVSALKASCLKQGRLNFGVSQKLLNLYLKYLWCLGEIPTPPHFPVDRIIQEKLGLAPVPWTQMQDDGDYRRIIHFARSKMKELGFNSLAELELELFSRR